MFNSFSRALGYSNVRMGVIGGDLLGWLTAAQGVQLGHDVLLWDDSPSGSAALDAGEANLEGAIRDSWQARRLRFTTSLTAAVEDSLVVAIALPIPRHADGTIDLAPLEQLARELAPCLVGHTLLILRSEVPAGTAARFQAWVTEGLAPGATIGMALCHERIVPGCALEEGLYGDRLLVGVDHPWDVALVESVLAPLERPVLITSIASAEALATAPTLEEVEHAFFGEIIGLCERATTELREVWDSLIFGAQPHRPALELAC